MKKILAVAAAAVVGLQSCSQGMSTKADHIPAQDTISYALGVMWAEGVHHAWSDVPFDTLDLKAAASAFAISKPHPGYMQNVQQQLDTIYADVLMDAFRTQFTNGKSKLKPEEAQMILQAKSMKKREADRAERMRTVGAKNETEGKAYLEENAKKEGVVVTESGLQYKIVKKGKGKVPTQDDKVKCLYKGTHLDGSVFDETSDGKPREFGVTGVIKGWTEALLMMPVGSKWQLAIPSEIAYGENGYGSIGPKETLLFDIELVEIVKK
ncbi:MAG: FKBP-type peptidyl-prolyl cis-trans isomerase [Bacteroidales bacterium]|nr:FKBP-type peptidyl-prolyl cis-trans isomerase [Bacteroidales bacterium]